MKDIKGIILDVDGVVFVNHKGGRNVSISIRI